MTEELIAQFGYVGIALILILGGLGLPIPEEAPIILAAILTRNGQMSWPLALATCLAGVLLGDFVVYGLGYFYGEKVLSLPLTRRLLTRQREAQIKGYFHRHGFKILVSGRFVPGFRTAAYLTAGILKLPPLKLLVTDLVAAFLSTTAMFGLGLLFAHQIQKGIREVQQWITVIVAVGVGGWLLHRYYRARQRAGLPVGPPVLEADEVPLPPMESPPRSPLGRGEPAASASEPVVDRPASPTFEADRPPTPAEGSTPASGDSQPEPRTAASEGGIRVTSAAAATAPSDPASIGVESSPSQPSVESPSR